MHTVINDTIKDLLATFSSLQKAEEFLSSTLQPLQEAGYLEKESLLHAEQKLKKQEKRTVMKMKSKK